MLTNLLLTADEHELCEIADTPKPPDGAGWTLVSFAAAGTHSFTYTVYLWARRKDGRPLAYSVLSSSDHCCGPAEVRSEHDALLRTENAALKERIAELEDQLLEVAT